MEAEVSFGAWLGKRRKMLDLTRERLAQCAGCSVSALRKIENDERRPSRQLAELLAGCLQISPAECPTFLQVARGQLPVERLAVAPQPASSGPPLPALPVPPTPLVGRESELAALAQILADPRCRLLTLVGPGGIGKTRLALATTAAQSNRFTHGVFFVSLAALAAPQFIVPTISAALGLTLAGPLPPQAQLLNHLRPKSLLLTLDNFEHLLEASSLLAEILQAAPQVKLLATSRERLNLQGEWLFDLQGLLVPPPDQEEEIEAYSAAALFIQSAQRARAGFQLSPADRTAVARICRLLEGMPLAIELAAAWTPALSCAEIAAELERGLDILVTPLRDVPERQRSMRAVFDHSWQLLCPEEESVLRQLSVFLGGFGREAAGAVAGATLPLLAALMAKSFLRRMDDGRFTMHELVRQYAAGRLAADPAEETAARQRHSLYFLDFIAGLEPDLKSARQLTALAAVNADIDNIRSAWIFGVQHGDLPRVQHMRAHWYYYDIRGWFTEAEASLRWTATELENILGKCARVDPVATVLLAYVRAQQGWFCLRLGKLVEAERLLQSSLPALRSSGKSIQLADALYYYGSIAWMTGDYTLARACYQEELALAEAVGNQWDIGLANGNLGLVAQTIGEYDEADQRWQEALTIHRTLGDMRMVAAGLPFFGRIKFTLGAYAEARDCFRESLALSKSLGDRWTYGVALCELGKVTQSLGDHVEAVRLLNESVTLLRELGEHWSTLGALNSLGAALLAAGALAGSRAAYSEALTLAWERQALPDVLAALGGLARCLAQQSDGEEMRVAALRTVFFILNHPAATQQLKDEACQLKTELVAQLGAAQVETAQTEAHDWPLAVMVENSLSTWSIPSSVQG
jgi:predicted ATPase/transcriptional regulator with XRE-family HTH domain